MSSILRAFGYAAVFAGSPAVAALVHGSMLLNFQSAGTGFRTVVSGRPVTFGMGGTVNGPQGAVLRFGGARPVRGQPAGPRAGTANYFLGPRQANWVTGLPIYSKIRYADLYPGIDLLYYGNEGRLEYDLVVQPGGSWSRIRFEFAHPVALDWRGNLTTGDEAAWITHSRPVIYQTTDGGRREIAGKYVLRSPYEAVLEIGRHDPRLPLVIDPTLVFASYLGGGGDDYAYAVAVDSSGCAYTVGETNSADFRTESPEQGSMAGSSDVFVTKWNADGSGLVYSTFIGGSNRDVGLGIAVDAAGNAYVTGFTYSADFPVTGGALRGSFVGASKAFVLKLNASGNALVYSTFLGGSGDDYGTGIALDAAGEAYITGYTGSVDFPVSTGALQHSYGGGAYDAFLAKLNAAGSALEYATYLGGLGNDTASAVATDGSGNVYVTGQTQSSNFPTYNALQPVNSESSAFVVKWNAAGQVLYSTYLGGTGWNGGNAIAADAAGNAYVTGFTDAPDFPVTSGAYQSGSSGLYDAFVAVLNTYGSGILCATYLGGSGADIGYSIGLDASSNVLITGSTNSIDFPMRAAIQPSYNGGGDGFVAAFDSQLTTLLYSTFFGGGGNDVAAGIAVDSTGSASITGWTSSGGSSLGLPITPGALQPFGDGGPDAFLAKLANTAGDPPPVPAVSAGSASGITASTATVNGTVNPNGVDADVWFQISGSSSMNDSSATPRQHITASSSAVPVSAPLGGLDPATTYYAQLLASSSAGSARSLVVSFETSATNTNTAAITSSPAGAAIAVSGDGCAPGDYLTPVQLNWNAGSNCTLTFVEPQAIGGKPYAFQTSTVNGSATSHRNPLALSAAGSLSINALFAPVTNISPGTATHFAVTAPVTATAGVPAAFTVTALDSSNQVVPTYTDLVHFSSTDPLAVLPGDMPLNKGTGTFTISPVTPGLTTLTVSDLFTPVVSGTSGAISVSQPAAGLRFVSLPPCRVVDTRDAGKPAGLGPPALGANSARAFPFLASPCGIPAGAQAYALNVTVVPHQPLGYLTVWPSGQNQPLASTLNALDGAVRANAAIVPAGTGGNISVFATNATDVVIDISGYFVPGTSGSGLAFYPLAPCRLVDTRAGAPSSILSGTLSGGSTHTLPVLSGSCGVPWNAQAYSLNFTLVPPAPVDYLTVYPSGQGRPVVSTLNDPTGTVQANAAVVPAGTGGNLSVYVTQSSDLVVDINGYFAPEGQGGLSLYVLPPCRVLDTRTLPGGAPFQGAMNVDVTGSGCGGTPAAQEFVFNATVVPQALLGYLTLWPEGGAQPLASTLNALNAQVISNMALVPSGNTEISAYAAGETYLILDLSAYFAP